MTPSAARIDGMKLRSRLHLVSGEVTATPDELLVRAGKGDREAFALLYDQVAATVYGLARRVVRDPQMAQDVAQEAFVEVWRQAPRFDPTRGKAISWIATVAHRRAIDRVRSEESRHMRENVSGSARDTITGGDEALAGVLAAERHEELSSALAGLTESQRQVIQLSFYDGHTYREVADLLGIPVGTAKTRIRDGLIKLRDVLASSGDRP